MAKQKNSNEAKAYCPDLGYRCAGSRIRAARGTCNQSALDREYTHACRPIDIEIKCRRTHTPLHSCDSACNGKLVYPLIDRRMWRAFSVLCSEHDASKKHEHSRTRPYLEKQRRRPNHPNDAEYKDDRRTDAYPRQVEQFVKQLLPLVYRNPCPADECWDHRRKLHSLFSRSI